MVEEKKSDFAEAIERAIPAAQGRSKVRTVRTRACRRPPCAQLLTYALALVQAGDTAGAVDELLALEKKCRIVRRLRQGNCSWAMLTPAPSASPLAQAADAFATSKVAVALVNLCYEAQDYKQLNNQILVLCKRRGQLKQARRVATFRTPRACTLVSPLIPAPSAPRRQSRTWSRRA